MDESGTVRGLVVDDEQVKLIEIQTDKESALMRDDPLTEIY